MTKDQLEDSAFRETTRVNRRDRRIFLILTWFFYLLAILMAFFVKPRLAAIPVALAGIICGLGVLILDAVNTLRNDNKVIYDLLKERKGPQPHSGDNTDRT